MQDLNGKRIWLTGASYGIGHALALELANRGAVLGLTARSKDKLDALRGEIESAGASAIVLPGDVTDADAIKQIAGKMREQLGGIDILIANAGTHVFTVPEQFDAEEYLDLMDLNYGGMLRCIEAVLPEMIEQRHRVARERVEMQFAGRL